jgi:hypothetical protein
MIVGAGSEIRGEVERPFSPAAAVLTLDALHAGRENGKEN